MDHSNAKARNELKEQLVQLPLFITKKSHLQQKKGAF